MIQLKVQDAINAVRKNLDEVGANDSAMYSGTDNNNLDAIIRKTIPEAVNAVNAVVPSAMLQGKILSSSGDFDSAYTVTDKVVRFSFDDTCLRMIAVQAPNCVVVSDYVDEVSPMGRMQLNPYTRGTYDSPVLVRNRVLNSVSGTRHTTFSFYSLKAYTGSGFPLTQVEYMPVCEYESGTLYHSASAGAYYDVSEQLKDIILHQLTGMVLAIYKENEKANYFFSLTGLTTADNE